MPVDPAKPFDLSFRVHPNWVEMRLDQFVKAMVPTMSRAKIQRYIKDGRVEVNGNPRPANWRVHLDDAVLLRCHVPEEGEDAGRHIPLDIVYEDDDVIAVNKQPGLVVHPVALHRHDTLLNALYWRYKDIIPADQEISMANRLDRNTSGIVLVSKHTGSKRILQDDFEARVPRKTYVALCEGIVEPDNGEIDAPIGPGLGRSDRCKMGVRYDEEGKPSLTHFEVLERFPPQNDEGFTLVKLQPHTGRQHQLRVHMSHLGNPLVCDDRYGRPGAIVFATSGGEFALERYALHALELTFVHPGTKQLLTLTAPLAEDLRLAVEALRNNLPRSRRQLDIPPEHIRREEKLEGFYL
jgi:23S rRNA pseudouridine1911/1915/1917 synthase